MGLATTWTNMNRGREAFLLHVDIISVCPLYERGGYLKVILSSSFCVND